MSIQKHEPKSDSGFKCQNRTHPKFIKDYLNPSIRVESDRVPKITHPTTITTINLYFTIDKTSIFSPTFTLKNSKDYMTFEWRWGDYTFVIW